MRKHLRCPKCENAEILHVPEPRDTDFDRMALGGVRSIWSGGVNGGLEAFVCLGCGYTELYVVDPRAIDVTKMTGARVLTGPKRDDDPYR